jgi:hypothetical protein
VAFDLDKYEFNIKVDEIKKLAAKKSYKEAAAIAREMNWKKVKDWNTLATVINVQEAAGDYLEARDMAILAYNRNLGGRKLVYKLTELLIKLEDFETAEELYDEYEKMSPHDVNRFILFYDLRKAQRASANELVEILEDYKEHEIDEKYLFELADLYAKTGRTEECIKTCDDIVLWFQDGVYVEKAIQLKKGFGAELTNTQKKILEKSRNKEEKLEHTREIMFEEQKQLARLQNDEIEDAVNEAEDEDYRLLAKGNTGGIKNFFKKAFGSKDEEDEEYEISGDDEEAAEDNTENASENDTEEDTQETAAAADSESDRENIAKVSLSLQELIEDAKKKLENSSADIEADEEDDFAEEADSLGDTKEIADTSDSDNIDIKVDIPNFNNPYNTQNIQAAIAKNLSEFMEEDEKEVIEEAEKLRPQPDTEDKEESGDSGEQDQIEGQLNLADWLESVREEKYSSQNTREFSKAELERMLDEKDEKSAAYEKIVAEKKALKNAAVKTDDELEAERKARAQVMLQAAKTDLAIRTGKATARLEIEADVIRSQPTPKPAKPKKCGVVQRVPSPESGISDTGSFRVVAEFKELEKQQRQEEQKKEELKKEELKKEEQRASLERAKTQEVPEVVTLNTAKVEYVTDDMIKKFNENTPDVSPQEAITSADLASAVKQDDISDDGERHLSGELAKIFRKYREMPGLESQLADYFASLEQEMRISSSVTGNIIISGNSSSDKSDLARTIVRAINYLYPDRTRKIAKTTGDSINHRGLAKAMNKLRGTALIVEGAGAIQPKRMAEVLGCLEQDTDRMIVILEDSDAEINVLLNFNPDMVNKFNHRIVLKQYTVNELVEMARKFARKRQYEVDDDALLALYLKIDRIRSNTDNIHLDDIKEIINQAIVKSEKRASRKFFGGLKKKRGEHGDIIFLSEADFKD